MRFTVVNLDDEDAPRKLDEAFQDTGFAILTGGDIPDPRELRSLGHAFFGGKTTEEKLRVNGDRGDAGYGNVPYVPLGGENNAQLLGDFSAPPDALESLTVRGLNDEAVRERVARDFPADLGAAMIEYSRRLSPLRERIIPLVESALGSETGSMGALCRDTLDSVRLGYYPDMSMGENQLRSGAHTDSYGITLLSLDPIAPDGLEVLVHEHAPSAGNNNNGEKIWLEVPFVPSALILNVGELLSIWTSRRWRASVHRVVGRPGARYVFSVL